MPKTTALVAIKSHDNFFIACRMTLLSVITIQHLITSLKYRMLVLKPTSRGVALYTGAISSYLQLEDLARFSTQQVYRLRPIILARMVILEQFGSYSKFLPLKTCSLRLRPIEVTEAPESRHDITGSQNNICFFGQEIVASPSI